MTSFDRRTLLRTTSAAGLVILLAGCGGAEQAPAPTRFFERIGKPIGLQLYALGDEAGTDLGATLAAVKAMGYGEIELPGLYGQTPADIRKLADAAGLPIASLHVPAAAFVPGNDLTFEAAPDTIAQAAETLGVKQLVIPFPILPDGFAMGEGEAFPAAISRAFSGTDLAYWQRTAARFNEIGAQMQERGIPVAYHNHNLEFAPLGDTTPWAVLMAETDPALLKVELDLGWVAQAGLDPATMLTELGPRVTSLHVKDVAKGGAQSFYFGATPTEVGSGRIDWASVLPIAADIGVAHYFVEQEPPFTIPRPEAMEKSAQFLLGLEA